MNTQATHQAQSSGLTMDLGMVLAAPVPMGQLWELHEAMQRCGLSLQPTRMVYDRLYALERLGQAHAQGDEALRALATQLFDRYQCSGEWIGLLH
ncbi:hypothetical protein ACG0Z6_08905 [Roseateles sp. BYS180W]|uniref:Uncharacterized protein n=1 Tax=Roseateles rivi TaxID=3299028 RepID=A0ABW7FVL6_9BURK